LKKGENFLRAVWILVFFILVFTPIVMLILGPKVPGRAVLLEISVALGFVGLAVMATQFLSTARFKFINKPFGTDLIYHFHRQIGIAAFLMVFAHPILLFILDTRYLRLLNLITAPWRSRAGVISVLALIFVVWFAEYRKKLKIPYQFWKFWHGIIATVMIALALYHIFDGGTYITQPWKQGLWIGYSVMLVGVLLYTRVVYPLRLIRKPYRVSKVIDESGDVWTIRMKPDGHEGFRFHPGQFAWLTAWNTPFADTEHPFSMASSAEETDYIEMSIKNLGPFTSTIKDFEPGQKVYLDGPFGFFTIDRYPEAERIVLIPGGIGVTPIISMIRTMADRGEMRPIYLFYCNLTWDTVAFREEVAELREKLDMQMVYTIERPPENWEGESGFLNSQILKKHLLEGWIAEGTEVFLCGPDPMMNAVEKALLDVGFEEIQVHTERYAFV